MDEIRKLVLEISDISCNYLNDMEAGSDTADYAMSRILDISFILLKTIEGNKNAQSNT